MSLTMVKELKTWEEANIRCLEQGSKLFANVDGTPEQLEFLYTNLDRNNHWLGIYTLDHVTWIDTEGNPIDPALLVWERTNAFNGGGNQYHVANWNKGPGSYLNDINKEHRLYFVCER